MPALWVCVRTAWLWEDFHSFQQDSRLGPVTLTRGRAWQGSFQDRRSVHSVIPIRLPRPRGLHTGGTLCFIPTSQIS